MSPLESLEEKGHPDPVPVDPPHAQQQAVEPSESARNVAANHEQSSPSANRLDNRLARAGLTETSPEDEHGDNLIDLKDGHDDGQASTSERVSADTDAGGQAIADRTQELSLLSNPVIPSETAMEPGQEVERQSTPPPPPPKDDKYHDPTPKTPLPSGPPSRSHSVAASTSYGSEDEGQYSDHPTPIASTAAHMDENSGPAGHRVETAESGNEIQSIMDQFDEDNQHEGIEGATSPRFELSNPLLPNAIQHPPRKSSLEPIKTQSPSLGMSPLPGPLSPSTSSSTLRGDNTSIPPRTSSIPSFSPSRGIPADFTGPDSPGVSRLSHALHKPPFPEPDPEPALPFDFHRFLEQLRHRTADPVAKFLRSFLLEFGKKQWMVHEQVKIISDFLAFITDKMAQCEIWRDVSDAEFDNAKEGMEKLVMNRLYTQTFSPAISPPSPIATKGKRRQTERTMGPGRKGQHQEDVERDDVLAQKVRIYGWVREEHLDIPPVGDGGIRFLSLAQQELLKIKTYRAPRDKVICVLNCCKVIFGLLRNSKSDQSADSFVPLLIYVVLQANPEHLVSNLQYIMRFRNQDKLGGEAGYYLSSLMGVVQFIENLDRTSLTVSDEDFEKNVEAAVSTIAEKHEKDEAPLPPQVHVAEKSSISRPEVTSRNSLEAEYSTPRKSTSSRDGTDTSNDGADGEAAVTGLLRTIGRPLSSIGRMFSEDTGQRPLSPHRPGPAQDARSPRALPLGNMPHSTSGLNQDEEISAGDLLPGSGVGQRRTQMSAEDAAARQASAETAEVQRIRTAEHANVVETLSAMFPDLDKEVIDDVVRMKEGRVGLAVDACLALST